MEPVFLTLEGTLVVWNYINVMVILPAALLVLEQLGVSNTRLFAWEKNIRYRYRCKTACSLLQASLVGMSNKDVVDGLPA